MRSCNNYSLFKARIYVFLIIVYARSYSHRTDASRSCRMRLRRFAISTVLNRMGAVIREKVF